MKFSYIAFDNKGKPKKGVTEAASLKEATKLLIDQGWYIKKISPKGKIKSGFQEFSFGRVSLVEKVLFVKHLLTMTKSGINLNEALEVISEQTSSKKFSKVISEILKTIRTGQSLAGAMRKFPKVFDPLTINMIRVGEESGTLEQNLDYLSGELEDRLELKRKIKAAAFYPAIVLMATLGLGLILSYFVLPKITKLFETLSFDLPLTTRMLLWFSQLMDKHGLIVIAGVIGTLIGIKIIIGLKPVKPLWHKLIIHMPIIGNIIVNYNLALFNRTLSILLKSGLTIDKSMVIVVQTTSNLVYKKKARLALPQIQKGKRLSDILSNFNSKRGKELFPLLVTKMIGVGERSGRLDESLDYLSEYFEKEVDNTTKNLTTVLEPILLVFVGLIVGFVAVSVISPIYQVTGQFRR